MPATFDDFADVYEALVDWPKRLVHEEPFYRALFRQVGARRVLDAACGTGHHAALFHGWGLEVEAADVSPAMIERARAAFGQPAGLRWVTRSFERPADPPQSFDVVLCVGNSLALASDEAAADRALAALLAAVRPGGRLVVQVLNLWRLPDGPCTWQKCLRADLPRGEVLILKGVHRCRERGYVDLAVAALPAGRLVHHESVPLLGLTAEHLAAAARRAGAETVAFFGGYAGEPNEPASSADLLMLAQR